jgi:hypothetical protein
VGHPRESGEPALVQTRVHMAPVPIWIPAFPRVPPISRGRHEGIAALRSQHIAALRSQQGRGNDGGADPLSHTIRFSDALVSHNSRSPGRVDRETFSIGEY